MQQMADLPKDKTIVAHAFSMVGIDFAGPFSYKEGGQRKPTTSKGPVAVYVLHH